MRRAVTPATLHRFMQELAASAQSPGKVYFTGGATALLLGFRQQTIDIDIKLDPEPKGVFEAIAKLKNSLDINVELASPDDFIPAATGWRERSRHIASIGKLQFFHYDYSLQALAKLERGYAQDIADIESLISGGHVTAKELRKRFDEIEPELIRYPAIDGPAFKTKLENLIKRLNEKGE
jgi:hypothetical protein